MSGHIAPGNAMILLRKALTQHAIPGLVNSQAIRFSSVANDYILEEPDGAGSVFTITWGAAGDGPGTYVTINRKGDYLLHGQIVTNTIDNSGLWMGRMDDGTNPAALFQDGFLPVNGPAVSDTFTWAEGLRSALPTKQYQEGGRIVPCDVGTRIWWLTALDTDAVKTSRDACKGLVWEITKNTPADARYATVFHP